VASVRFTSLSRRQRVHRAYIELGLCVVFPLVMLAVSYIVQESRYALVEDVGCVFPAYVSWPSIIIANVIPSVVSMASLVYSGECESTKDRVAADFPQGLAIRWFIRRRMEFQKILSSNSPSLNTGRYLRLIAFAVIDVLFSIGANTFALAWVLSTIKLSPWKGFAYTHEDFSMISQTSPPSGSFQWEFIMSLYVPPLYSFLFFIFFGFGEEAIKEYQRAWSYLLNMLPALFTTQ
jgi:pheromone a factor receptor